MIRSDGTASLLNPPARLLGRCNAIFSGATRRRSHHVPEMAGPLSVKTMLRGEGVWRTPAGSYRLRPDRVLVLNAGQRYSLAIERGAQAETLCAFFRDGFVADVARVAGEREEALLDAPFDAWSEPGFLETLRPASACLTLELSALRAALSGGELEPLALDEAFQRVAFGLLRSERGIWSGAQRLAGARAATRLELLRRLSRARDLIEADCGETLDLDRLSRVACLSPFHFHRQFRALYGETPHAYLTRRRLERARDLLERGDRSVTEVCFAVGFRSPSSFGALFRRRFGVAPGRHLREKSKIRQDGTPGPA